MINRFGRGWVPQLVLATWFTSGWPGIAFAHLPEDFVLETYAAGLQRPVDIEWASNGLLFVAEKSGTIAVVENGSVLPAPFLNIREQVNRAADRGLLGITLHPNFPATPWVYLVYDYDPPETEGLTGNDRPDGPGQRVSRLTRVTADAATGYRTAVAGSEIVIVGKASIWANIGDPTAEQNDIAPFACGPDGAFVDDCIPADGISHSIGTVAFGEDGMLYMGNGDSSTWSTVNPGSLRALRIDSLAGKILRVHPETGEGLSDNPYWDGNPNSNRSRVWQLGLRNPYRFRINPADGELWIADVGWEDWEELNHGPAGADFGWPCYEGGNAGIVQQPGYAALTECQAYYPVSNALPPVYAYPHRSGSGGSVIAGEFYQASKWPVPYHGTLMLSDYSYQELSIATISGNTVSVVPFASEILSVDLAVGPDGDIYSANVVTGDIQRIRYTGDGSSGGGGNRVAAFIADFTGPAPSPGWSYHWNSTADLGELAGEQSLLWSAGRYDSDGIAGLPDATEMNYGYIGGGTMHPGRGQANGAASDRFAIARYSVPQNGYYDIRNGLLTHTGCQFTNGVELAILVDDQVIHRHAVAGAGSDVIAEDLGYLTAGTAISVAVGPAGSDGCDGVDIDWEIYLTPGTPPIGDPPLVTIASPQDNDLWRVNDTVTLSGSATDTEDGVLGDMALQWDGVIIHNTHTHPDFYFGSGAGGELIYPDHGDNSYVELCLIATDSDLQQGRACVDLRPELSNYSFQTNPSGLSLTYNGESDTTPYSVELPVGGERLISAPWLQGDFVFTGWSVGGQATQQIVIGDTDQVLIANYDQLPGAVQQLTSTPQAGSDDAEENASGTVQTGSSDLELTRDVDLQVVGIRFPGVGIAPGALITDAYIQFTVDEASSDPSALTIQVQEADNPGHFLAQANDISGRPRSAARISWSPAGWVVPGEAGLDQRTPNLAELVTAIVNRPGWSSGNALVFIISGTGKRVAHSFNGSAPQAPMLSVSFANPVSSTDTDEDGVVDAQDNCIEVANGPLQPDAGGQSQRDGDGDGYGNACDADLNNDGQVNFTDLGLFRQRFGSADAAADFDGSGVVNFTDLGIFRQLFGQPPGPSGTVP